MYHQYVLALNSNDPPEAIETPPNFCDDRHGRQANRAKHCAKT